MAFKVVVDYKPVVVQMEHKPVVVAVVEYKPLVVAVVEYKPVVVVVVKEMIVMKNLVLLFVEAEALIRYVLPDPLLHNYRKVSCYLALQHYFHWLFVKH